MTRDTMEYDVVIVGAGPSGLAAAIRLKQLAAQAGRDTRVCVVEKGAEVGAHILSGAVLEPRALDELLPDWRDQDTPVRTPVGHETFMYLRRTSGFTLPGFLVPPAMRNHGNYIISLGSFCRWLGDRAEELGVEIYPGFAASQVLYNESGAVIGVATGDMGVGKNGEHKSAYQPGIDLHARYTFFAEGCRGSLGKSLMEKFDLAADCQPQTYALGLKELWEVDPRHHRQGAVMHSVGWPLESSVYGGSFMYHLEDNQVAVGFVVALDYTNPYLSPYDEFQRFKTHPKIRPLFAGARRVAYGARALNEGGWQSLPRLVFPGGVLIGCEAGTLNVPKIKGTHTAMKSGMLAAEAAHNALWQGKKGPPPVLNAYAEAFAASWAARELRAARNVRPGFSRGLLPGMVHAGIDQLLLRGRAPWTLRHGHGDHETLRRKEHARPIDYPKPDGVLTFDKLTNVAFSGTNHEEDQPCHLVLKDPARAIDVNLAHYDAPEQRYCPAGVYEIVAGDEGPCLRINAQNCLHCKTCDIKDLTQNITWVAPEGGGGPNYPNM